MSILAAINITFINYYISIRFTYFQCLVDTKKFLGLFLGSVYVYESLTTKLRNLRHETTLFVSVEAFSETSCLTGIAEQYHHMAMKG